MNPAPHDHNRSSDVKRGMANEALVIIDMLNDFVLKGAPLEVANAADIVHNIRERIDAARKSGIPVLYVCDRHKRNDPEFKVWPAHAVVGTKGSEVVDKLKPLPSDIVVSKTTYSGFFDTDLESHLKRLNITKLILTGVCTEICVLYTAADAYMRGYQVEVPEDCVAGLAEDDHRFALKQMTRVLKPRQR